MHYNDLSEIWFPLAAWKHYFRAACGEERWKTNSDDSYLFSLHEILTHETPVIQFAMFGNYFLEFVTGMNI